MLDRHSLLHSEDVPPFRVYWIGNMQWRCLPDYEGTRDNSLKKSKVNEVL